MLRMTSKLGAALVVLAMVIGCLTIIPEDASAADVDWVLEGRSPGERTSFVSAELPDGRIFVTLGYNSSATSHVNSSWILDPTDMSWTQVSDSPVMTESSTGAYLDGKVYIFGGMLSNYTYMTTVLIYDVATDSWSTGPDMPRNGTYFKCTAIDETTILLVGGGNTDTERCFFFDIEALTFSDAADLPDGRSSGALVNAGDYLIYFGGWDATSTLCDEIFLYDISDDYWWTTGFLPEPLAGITAAAGSDGLIYLLGGATSSSWYGGNVQSATAWDLYSGDFISLPDLAESLRYGTAFETSDGRIVFFGGHDDSVGNTNVYSIQAWEMGIEQIDTTVAQGDDAWVDLWVRANFAPSHGLFCTIGLVQDNVTWDAWEFGFEGGEELMMRCPIPESMPAGEYQLVILNVNIGLWTQDFLAEPMTLTVTEADSTDDMLQDLMDQNGDLQDQLDDLSSELADTQDQLDAAQNDLSDAIAGKQDAMFGYVILALVLVSLVIGVVILVRKK